MLAPRTNEVVGQGLAFVLIATDFAAPNSLLDGLRTRLDVGLIKVVGSRSVVGERFHLVDVDDKERVSAQIDGLRNVTGDEGIRAARHSQCAVCQATAVGKVSKFIDVASRLKAEMLKQFEVGFFADYRHGNDSRTLDEFVGKVCFVDRHTDAIRLVGNLDCRIGDTAVIAALEIRSHHKQSVLNVEHWVFCHSLYNFYLLINLFRVCRTQNLASDAAEQAFTL